MRILGVIPARGGSKGVLGKNHKTLHGKPLIAYTLATAKKSKLLSNFVVSTDSDKVVEACVEENVDVPFKRPEELSGDKIPTLPVLKHALEYFAEKGEHFDAVCILQPTSPFREDDLIDNCIRKMEKTRADTLITVKKIPAHYNPHWVFEADQNDSLVISTGEEKIISRRQDLPEGYIRDGKVYLIKNELIMNENTLYGKKIVAYESSMPAINIDTMEDWVEAEQFLEND